MLASGTLAYNYKQKFKNKIKMFNEAVEYVSFCKNNISFYKENLYEINSKYNIMHENKNAKSNLFILKNNTYQLNYEKVVQYLKPDELDYINQFIINIGTQDYQVELDRCDMMINYLYKKKDDAAYELKNKGELWFKIILMIGAVISIIVWWHYGCFCFI